MTQLDTLLIADITKAIEEATPENYGTQLQIVFDQLGKLVRSRWNEDYKDSQNLWMLSQPFWREFREVLVREIRRSEESEAHGLWLSSGGANVHHIAVVASEATRVDSSSDGRESARRSLRELIERARSENGHHYKALRSIVDLMEGELETLPNGLPSISHRNGISGDTSEDRILDEFRRAGLEERVGHLRELKSIGGPEVAAELSAHLENCPLELRCRILEVLHALASERYLDPDDPSTRRRQQTSIGELLGNLKKIRPGERCGLLAELIEEVERHAEESRNGSS